MRNSVSKGALSGISGRFRAFLVEFGGITDMFFKVAARMYVVAIRTQNTIIISIKTQQAKSIEKWNHRSLLVS